MSICPSLPLRVLALAAIAAPLALAGCGRRGALEMPVEQTAPAAKPASEPGLLGESVAPASKPAKPVAPKQPLFIDNLL